MNRAGPTTTVLMDPDQNGNFLRSEDFYISYSL